MTITAKYAGHCAKCGKDIRVGDKIEWSKGSKPEHTNCDSASTDQAVPSVKGGASEKQLATLRRLANRLECIGGFDSYGGTGYDCALEVRAKISAGLTSHEASKLIGWAMSMVEDEM